MGTEYPVLQPLVREYFSREWTTDYLSVEQAASYACQSIAFTKGWTRGVAFVLAAYFLVEHDLVGTYREHCTVTQEFGSELDRIKQRCLD